MRNPLTWVFGILGVAFVAAGITFFVEPGLIPGESTIISWELFNEPLLFFNHVLPIFLGITAALMLLVGLYDGLQLKRDYLMLVAGAVYGFLAAAFWLGTSNTIALFDQILPDGNAVLVLSVLIGLGAFPPFYAAYKIAQTRHLSRNPWK
ncbi:MAG: hypothetical protein WBK28_03415 [Minisyncoccia bacterium]